MTDRELLELAAKAAGYNVRWHDIWECFVHEEPYNITNPPTLAGQRLVWVPLSDDGDALRLGVKLGIDMHFRCSGVYTNIERLQEEFFEPKYSSDPYAATRRAIVRAAAELGKG
jgi:hypothetical protein